MDRWSEVSSATVAGEDAVLVASTSPGVDGGESVVI